MESPQNIKKRLKSVDNIKKITKAMEMVAATKMRKSQEIAIASRPYAFAALDLLATVSKLDPAKLPPLFQQRKIESVLFVLVSSDKGLAGAFNSSVFRKFEQHMRKSEAEYSDEQKFYIAVGEKAFQYLLKKKCEVVKKFTQIGDYTELEQVRPITDFIIEGYLTDKWDRVVIVSTHFRTALKQEPHVRMVLPITLEGIKETVEATIPERGKFADLMKEQEITFIPNERETKDFLIEPSSKDVLDKLGEHLFFVQMYDIILEANASEHSARRMAMKTASDNASDLGEILNLQYNKSRQAKITTEIAEISAGAEALS